VLGGRPRDLTCCRSFHHSRSQSADSQPALEDLVAGDGRTLASDVIVIVSSSGRLLVSMQYVFVDWRS